MQNPPIPFIDLHRIVCRIRGAVLTEFEQVLDNLEFVAPPRVGALEAAINTALGTQHTFCCANGTDAITLALQAAGIGRGSRVAVPNLTFWASYEAIVSVGATPVLVDIHPQDLQLSLVELQSAHAQFALNGVVFPHLFGFASHDLHAIRAFCREHQLALIEDGAQCFGVQVNGVGVLADAEIGTLSFYPAKVIGGCMDGGAVVGSNGTQVALARKLGNHGRSHHYSYSHVGWNSRMGGLQAAFITEVLKLSSEIIESRLAALSLYRSLYQAHPQIHDRIELVLPPPGIIGNGYLSVFLLRQPNADAVRDQMQAHGIGCGRTYPETIGQQPCCTDDLRASGLKVSQDRCKRLLNLPLFAFITPEECERSFETLVRVLTQ